MIPVRNRQPFWQLAAGYLACGAVLLSLLWIPGVKFLDLKLLDLQFNLLRAVAPTPAADNIRIVGIDEDTYSRYAEPLALWHEHLGDLFKAFAVGGVRVVGLDIALPEKSFNPVVAGIDQKLMSGLLAMRKSSHLVLGTTVLKDGTRRRIYPPYVSLVGRDNLAFVLWQQDADRVVRRFRPDLPTGETQSPSMVAVMLRKLGIEPGSGLIDFALGAPYDYIPLHEVVQLYRQGERAALRALFEGQHVFVGETLPFEDRHYQPVNLAGWEQGNNNFVPGVLIHAQGLRSILADRLIQPVALPVQLGLLLLASLLWWLPPGGLRSPLLSLVVAAAALGAQSMLLRAGGYLPVAAIALGVLIAMNGRLLSDTLFKMIERQRMKRAFSGFASPQVINDILEGRIEPGVRGQRSHLCVMFSDIRNFTTTSESMEPEEIVSFLNRYLGAMAGAIHEYDGTVVCYMGDGIMAIFGAPNALEDPANNAFLAAQRKLERLEDLNRELAAEGGMPRLEIGIGLHAGDAVVGNIGSSERYEYTAIGDVINTASRLEGLTKQLGFPLVVSDRVAEALRSRAQFEDLGDQQVKGRAAVHVFGWRPATPDGNRRSGAPPAA